MSTAVSVVRNRFVMYNVLPSWLTARPPAKFCAELLAIAIVRRRLKVPSEPYPISCTLPCAPPPRYSR